jgi:hypothetical protein
MKNLFVLFVLGLASVGFAKPVVYQTRLKPAPKAGETVKLYQRDFLSCKELAEPVIRACPAYGVLGLRLCYVKAKGPTYFVATNDYVPHLGDYNGNDCMERFRLMRYMCKVGVETGRFTNMYCLQR